VTKHLNKVELFVAEVRRLWPDAQITVRKRLDVDAVVDRLIKLPGFRMIRFGPGDAGAIDSPWLYSEINKILAVLPEAERHDALHLIHLRLWRRAGGAP